MKIKRARSSYLLIVGIIGLLIGGSWLIYEVFAASFKSQVEEREAKNIIPISGRLNDKVISNLKTRRDFSSVELNRVESIDYEESKGVKEEIVEEMTSMETASEAAEVEVASESGEVDVAKQ